MARADRLLPLPRGLRGEVVAPDVDVTRKAAEVLPEFMFGCNFAWSLAR